MGQEVLHDSEVMPPLDLHEEFRYQAKHPPGEDQITGALFGALLEEPADSELSRAIEVMSVLRTQGHPDVSASEIAGVVRASICTYLLSHDEDFSYRGLTTPERWRPKLGLISEAIRDEHSQSVGITNFYFNLVSRKVQTSLPDRYKSLALLLQTSGERFSKEVAWLDVGSGVMEGAQQLATYDRFPMKFSAVSSARTSFDEPDRRLTGKINRLLKREPPISQAVCNDVENIYYEHYGMHDPTVLEWARGSLRPSEHLDRKFMKKFDALAAEKAPHVRFVKGDLNNPGDAERIRDQVEGRTFDVVSFMTSLHQVTKAQREVMLERASELLSDDGMVVVQDFAYLPASKRPLPFTSLQTYQHWHVPGHYRTHVYDALHPQPGLQETFYFKDSRCQELLLGTAQLMVDGALTPIDEAIHRA